MIKNYLTEKEYRFIQNELKDIQFIKKMDEIIKKELINKNEYTNPEEKVLLIKDEDNKKENKINLSTEEELFKKNIIEISDLKKYEYINILDYFKGDLNNQFNKKYTFNRNYKNFKLFISNNYETIRKEDFLTIYKLFLQNYKINEDMFKTDIFLEKEKINTDLNEKNKLANIYLIKIKEEISKLINGKNFINEKYIDYIKFYNIDKEKKGINNFYNVFKNNSDILLTELEKRRNLWDNFYDNNKDVSLIDYKDEIEKENSYEKDYDQNVQKFLDNSYNTLTQLIDQFNLLRGDDNLREKEKIKDKYRTIRENILNKLRYNIIKNEDEKKSYIEISSEDFLDQLTNKEDKKIMKMYIDKSIKEYNDISTYLSNFLEKVLSQIPIIKVNEPFLKENVLNNFSIELEKFSEKYYNLLKDINNKTKEVYENLKKKNPKTKMKELNLKKN